jgi:hypothetical protein
VQLRAFAIVIVNRQSPITIKNPQSKKSALNNQQSPISPVAVIVTAVE